jgi:hypothetical protein
MSFLIWDGTHDSGFLDNSDSFGVLPGRAIGVFKERKTNIDCPKNRESKIKDYRKENDL